MACRCRGLCGETVSRGRNGGFSILRTEDFKALATLCGYPGLANVGVELQKTGIC